MTTREDATALVRRMQECFNTRQSDQARFAEMWGAATGFPPMTSPEDVLG